MTDQRKEQIRKECEAEANALHERVIRGRYPDVSDEIIENGRRNGADTIKAITDLLTSERIKAEELIEAGEAMRESITTYIRSLANSDERDEARQNMGDHAAQYWPTTIAKYRTP